MEIVIDANITLSLFIHLPYSTEADAKFKHWRKMNDQMYAPSLWHAEIVSAVKKNEVNGLISEDDARLTLASIAQFPVEVVTPNRYLLDLSFLWAGRLGQIVAYDAQYLALAEYLNAEFWTADKRLFQKVSEINISWVHLIQG